MENHKGLLGLPWSGVRMANTSHPTVYFPFHSFISLGARTLLIIVSTNQMKILFYLSIKIYIYRFILDLPGKPEIRGSIPGWCEF